VLLQQVEHGLRDSGETLAQAIHNAPGLVFRMLQTQTAVLAYNDVFLITAGLSFIMIPTALLMSGSRAKQRVGGSENA
jgi:DHA2 family multidrug resistance protein